MNVEIQEKDDAGWIDKGTDEPGFSVRQLSGFHLACSCRRGWENGGDMYDAIRIGFFNTDTDVVNTGVSYMYIIACTFGFIGFGIIFSRAFSGAGDTVPPLVITAIGFVGLRVSLSVLFSSLMGLKGVWFGITASTVIQGLLAAFWFNKGRWKSKKI